MTWRRPAASRSQNATSHQSIEAAPPLISRTVGSVGSPKVCTHRSMPLARTIRCPPAPSVSVMVGPPFVSIARRHRTGASCPGGRLPEQRPTGFRSAAPVRRAGRCLRAAGGAAPRTGRLVAVLRAGAGPPAPAGPGLRGVAARPRRLRPSGQRLCPDRLRRRRGRVPRCDRPRPRGPGRSLLECRDRSARRGAPPGPGVRSGAGRGAVHGARQRCRDRALRLGAGWRCETRSRTRSSGGSPQRRWGPTYRSSS